MEAPHNVIWLLINVAEASDRLRDARSQLKEQDFSWQRLDAVTPCLLYTSDAADE